MRMTMALVTITYQLRYQLVRVLVQAIEDVNVTVATFQDDGIGDVAMYPEKVCFICILPVFVCPIGISHNCRSCSVRTPSAACAPWLSACATEQGTVAQHLARAGASLQGTVCFAAGLHAWAFTIPQWAAFYASRTSVPYAKWLERLWGKHFYDAVTRKWSCSKSASNVRGFVEFIHEPVAAIIDAAMADDKVKLRKMCENLGVASKLSALDWRELTGKALMKRVMQVRAVCHAALVSQLQTSLSVVSVSCLM
jgi:hypothetical protein